MNEMRMKQRGLVSKYRRLCTSHFSIDQHLITFPRMRSCMRGSATQLEGG